MDNETLYPVFPSAGAFIKYGEDKYAKAILGASVDGSGNQDGLTVYFSGWQSGTFPVGLDELTIDENTGIIRFNAYDADYLIREFREEDGLWLSAYQTVLPVDALVNLTEGPLSNMDVSVDPNQEESMTAYATDDSGYVLGLVYNDSVASWLRTNGDWALLSDDDDTFDDMIAIPIDPTKADDFVNLFDTKHPSITEANTYSDLSEEDSDLEPEDNGSDETPVNEQ
jgi:hypothetical protein